MPAKPYLRCVSGVCPARTLTEADIYAPRDRLNDERQRDRNAGNNRARLAPPPAQQAIENTRPHRNDYPGGKEPQPLRETGLDEREKSCRAQEAEPAGIDDEELGIETSHAGNFCGHSADCGPKPGPLGPTRTEREDCPWS